MYSDKSEEQLKQSVACEEVIARKKPKQTNYKTK